VHFHDPLDVIEDFNLKPPVLTFSNQNKPCRLGNFYHALFTLANTLVLTCSAATLQGKEKTSW